MQNTLRSAIVKQIARSLKQCRNERNDRKVNVVSELTVKYNSGEEAYSYSFPVQSKEHSLEDCVNDIRKSDLTNIFDDIAFEQEKFNCTTIRFNVSREKHIKSVVENYRDSVAPPVLPGNARNLIVEFSSPNIAKPFHFGHLRSTITGNYVANISDYLGHRVKRINYLGDWGTQFGLLQLGVEQAKFTEEDMEKNPLALLQKAYISANEQAKVDPSVNERARTLFRKLETGEDTVLHQAWAKYKEYTIEELESTYSRIGISFDEYHWESTYNARNVEAIIAAMESGNILETDEQNRKVVRVTTEKSIPVLKSDRTTLYITRDIAAAIDRYDKNKFDSMYYVVDNTQSAHFYNLIAILKKMGSPCADRLEHIGFGRINGMSSRKGTAVRLDDILNEMRAVMRENQTLGVNTKVDLTADEPSADILGISAIIVNNFKHRRKKDYTFDWNKIFEDVKGDSGTRLQYSHCRLTSLEENSGAILARECDPSLLRESCVDALILALARFDEAVLKSFQTLEPCILTIYLFSLSNAINGALKTLTVKNQPSDLQNQRLLLFHAAKNVLAQGMRLLGLVPLKKM